LSFSYDGSIMLARKLKTSRNLWLQGLKTGRNLWLQKIEAHMPTHVVDLDVVHGWDGHLPTTGYCAPRIARQQA
jgi:hypothetical protein